MTHSTDKEFTEAQNAAIYTIDRSTSVVAGAGSGKTTVLIERCCHIIGDDWSELDRLLAITFTEKAAAELKARLRKRMPPRDRYRLETAWIGTFHACCARMLRQHAPLIGLDPAFAIMDENAAKLASRRAVKLALLDLLEERDESASFLVDAIDFRTATGALEDLMGFRWHARRSFEKPESDDAEELKILKALAHLYSVAEEKLLAQFDQTGALDFQELEIRTLSLLEGNPDVLKAYRKRFKHLLVDEFQDTNDIQTELVLNMYEPGTNQLCIVGDPRQSIYRFRGANIDCFATALERIRNCKGETIHLAENFRSRHGIVTFVNASQQALADGLFGRLTIDGITSSSEGMKAARISGDNGAAVATIEITTDPKTKVADRRTLEAEAVAGFISKIVREGDAAWGDVVCLFQALTGVAPYEAAFKKAGVPFRLFGGRGFLKRQEVVDLINLLGYASDPTDHVSLLGLLRSPFISLSDDELVELAGPDGKSLISAVATDPRCKLLEELGHMAKHLRPSEVIRQAIDMTGFEILCKGSDDSSGATANIDRFIELAESIERQEPTPLAEFTGFIRELKKQSARLGNPPASGDASKAVRCMTVHAAKGLEFPVVILPDLFRKPHNLGGSWQFSRHEGVGFKLKDKLQPFGPRKNTDLYTRIIDEERSGDSAESKRLLYVAMTRARDLLVLPIHPGMKSDGPWHKWLTPIIEASDELMTFSVPEGRIEGPFGDVIIESEKDSETPELVIERASAQQSEALSKRSSFTVSQLESFDRCPQEYYMKYVLGLPASDLFVENSEKLPANIFGSIIHGVLERYGESGASALEDLIKTECIANGVVPDSVITGRVEKAIEEAMILPIMGDIADGKHEVRFDWRIDDHFINGSIDWLKSSGDGLEIVDFKTDDVREGDIELRAKEYDLQLMCYALASECATENVVTATSLVFLKPHIVHTTKLTDERRDEGVDRIKSIISNIEGLNFSIGEQSPPCFKCPYHHNGMCWIEKNNV
jgi:ATP-dependent helicase/nuclease subunit A